jgi:glutaminase
MLNTFVLMLALALSPAEAAHKQHHKHTAHHHAPTHRAHRVLAWTWVPGHYDVHGHWIRARWVFGIKVTV